MTEQKIYLICIPCNDSYYQGHPTKVAFTTKEAADKHIAQTNSMDDEEFGTNSYIQEVILYS